MPRSRAFRRHLPHWHLDGATYFVTWCLHHEQPCLGPHERTLVCDALRHFDGTRYDLHASVVMDDHVHVVARPLYRRPLSGILQNWKSYTAHRLTADFERRAPVWQDESYDRVVRDERELGKVLEYVRDNPRRRWPGVDRYPWIVIPTDGSGGLSKDRPGGLSYDRASP